MSDEIDIETIHEKLFSGASLKIGKIQWYLSKADFEMEKLCFTEGNHGQRVATAFGQEVNDNTVVDIQKRNGYCGINGSDTYRFKICSKIKRDIIIVEKKVCS